MARGLIANAAGTQLFVVVGNALYKVSPAGVRTSVGTLLSDRGTVDMAMGLTQLVIVDGLHGYVYDLLSGVFTRIVSDGWLGSSTVDYDDGYFTLVAPNSQTAYISANEDALTLDPLDFITANASPDKLVGQRVVMRQWLLFGTVSGEVWQDSGGADFPFERNSGAILEVGLMAAHSARVLDNSIFWLGRDANGAGMVYKLEGLHGIRISTNAVDEDIQAAIASGADVSKATAFAFQMNGRSQYWLKVPGCAMTWVYDIASGEWTNASDFVDGEHIQHRATHHAYCYGKHLVVGDDDVIDYFDVNAYTNRGDPLVRERTSPHYATPQLDRITFGLFELDCTVGFGKSAHEAATAMLAYSNDGGYEWSDFRRTSLGAVGDKTARARWLRLGSARDRVWRVRCADDVAFAIVNANIQ